MVVDPAVSSMGKFRHLLSSVQRGGILVSFFICCRRSRERVRVREWESIVIFVVHPAGAGMIAREFVSFVICSRRSSGSRVWVGFVICCRRSTGYREWVSFIICCRRSRGGGVWVSSSSVIVYSAGLGYG